MMLQVLTLCNILASVRGLQAAIKNANDGISVVQTAEGAMEEVGNILQRMRELAVQASNDSNSDADRAYLQDEVAQLRRNYSYFADNTIQRPEHSGWFIPRQVFPNWCKCFSECRSFYCSVAADSLGIGTTVSSFSVSTTITTTTVATEEIARVNFTFDDTYSFKLTDRETGLNYQIQGDKSSITAGDINATLNRLSLSDHGLRTGDEIALSGNGSMTGTFYAIKIDEDTIQVATSKGNAINGTFKDIQLVQQLH